MRIGIDATSWTNWRGFGRFTRSIVQALVAVDRGNEYVLFFDRTYRQCEGIPQAARHVEVRTSATQTEAISVDGRRTSSDLLRMTLAVRREGLDLFFCPSIDSYFPIVGPAARVVMIHDVIPETFPVMLPGRLSRWRRRLKVRTAIRQSHIVATGSEYVRRRIGTVFGIEGDRISVIPYGVSERFRPPESREAVQRTVFDRHGVRAPYLLHVGGFGPNKNIVALLEGIAALSGDPKFSEAPLVFVGKREDDAIYDEAREIDRLLARGDVSRRVRFVGFQSDDDLIQLYQGAAALMLPSRVEGFGLPAVEAVCCGVPAIVTSESPLGDVLGDAAIVVAPDDHIGLVRAMERTLTDEGLRRRALVHSGEFGWEISARAAMAAFARAREKAAG